MNAFFMGKNFNDLPTKIEEILSIQVDIRTFFVYDTSKDGESGRIFRPALFHENEIYREYQTDGGGKVIPLQRFVVKGYRGKEREYGERDNLLYDFELDE